MAQDITPFQRTLDNLKLAKLRAGEARQFIKAAKHFNAMLPTERKTVSKAEIDISEAIDKIQNVMDSVSIILKHQGQ